MPLARLTDRAVLAVTGDTAADFLHGLVTNDVIKLILGSSTYAALLTPQGKIVTDFLVHATSDGFHLDVAAAHAPDLLKRLKLYRLRAPITLEDISTTRAVFAAWDPSPPHPEEGASAPVSKDPRFAALGRRWIGAPGSETPDADLADYHVHRLTLGIPDSADTEGQFALDANLEELHGLDFKKGCYVGQEVTARMKHKAAPRRRLARILLDGPAPAPGSRLTDSAGTEVGEFKTGLGTEALASIRLDRIVASNILISGDISARIAPAAYDLPPLTAALQPAPKATNE